MSVSVSVSVSVPVSVLWITPASTFVFIASTGRQIAKNALRLGDLETAKSYMRMLGEDGLDNKVVLLQIAAKSGIVCIHIINKCIRACVRVRAHVCVCVYERERERERKRGRERERETETERERIVMYLNSSNHVTFLAHISRKC